MATEDWRSRSRSTLAFAIVFSAIGLLVTIGFVSTIVISRVGRRAEMRMTAVNGSIKLAPMTAAPAMSPRDASVAQSGETALEASADQTTVSGNDTILIKTFALTPGSKFSIKNMSGSISIEAWDQPKIEVTVIKRGPDRGAQLFFTDGANSLSLRTGVVGNNSQDVRYQVKAPRHMRRVDLNSVNGSIKLSGVTGEIFIESVNGSIELVDVTGVSKVQTRNGRITATLEEASDGPMEFIAVNGSIYITIRSDFDADLEANTVHGSINLDDEFGIAPQRELVGQRARGQIGKGGQLLKIATVNGSIRLAKQ